MGASTKHQFILANLYHSLHLQTENHEKAINIFAPFRVKFPKATEENDGFSPEPDLIGVSNPENLMKASYVGVPEFVVEILSKATRYEDETEKKDNYEVNGVKEYWMIDQWKDIVFVYKYNEVEQEFHKPEIYSLESHDKIKIDVFPSVELEVSLSDIFNFKCEVITK